VWVAAARGPGGHAGSHPGGAGRGAGAQCEVPGSEGVDPRLVFGPAALPAVGRGALLACFAALFATPGGDDPAGFEPVGVVVTRPPESVAVVRGRGARLFLRDSHRNTQFDFADLAAFLRWAAAEPAYFAPMPGLPHAMNEVALFTVGAGPALLVLDSMHELLEDAPAAAAAEAEAAESFVHVQ
jgi:hypothetical protein